MLFPLPLKFFKASHISKTFKSKSSTLSFPMDLGDMNICGIRQCYRSNYNIFDIAKKLSNSNNVRTLLTAGTCIISARWARQNTFTAIRELLAVVEWRTFFASRPTQKALLLWDIFISSKWIFTLIFIIGYLPTCILCKFVFLLKVIKSVFCILTANKYVLFF